MADIERLTLPATPDKIANKVNETVDLIISGEIGGKAEWGGITGNIETQTDLASALAGKVDKVTGKGLSTNDYTSEEKSKLSGIAANATSVADNHSVTNGTILINGSSVVVYNDADIRQALAGFNKGYVISGESAITGTKNPTTGDWSNVTAITGITLSSLKVGDNVYLIDNTAPDFWVSQVSPSVSLNVLDTKTDLSNYYNKSEVDTLLGGKASPTSTNFIGAETVKANGTSGSINISQGRLFTTTASTITLPTPVAGVTITVKGTANSISNWGSNIKWADGSAPDLPGDGSEWIVMFQAFDTSKWYGVFAGGGFA